ncbi:cwf18 pre-mRNA splicing factor-domain-containing protein [Mycena albidolilacea]|uniref:Cwf18 pre-mRNA splicing factor-domain-containing protein n=1 Tax=Mycena albidolilacea TaxID=1033008 RepID=A0AAD7EPH2_9AGAR|nr:cwf18 pre-mRNA splicing factor-domain-containing protein [Mycena albidolilacea]
MSLATASEARKERLLALKRKKDGVEGDGPAEPVIKSRNFDPESRTLKKRAIISDDVEMEDTVERDVAGLAEKIITEDEERRAQELDVFNIAPKRPNWDLKREMDKKLAKLQRRTQESIHTLIRQRLAAQKGDADDIAGAIRAQVKAQNADENEDDDD